VHRAVAKRGQDGEPDVAAPHGWAAASSWLEELADHRRGAEAGAVSMAGIAAVGAAMAAVV
jgi:hypothetical protein